MDADGKSSVLTDKDKKTQVKLSNKHIALYCKKLNNEDG